MTTDYLSAYKPLLQPFSDNLDRDLAAFPTELPQDDRPSTAARTSPPRILVAEDDGEMRSLLVLTLHRAGYDVQAVNNGLDLCRDLVPQLVDEDEEPFDLVITDVRMPGVNGLEILEGLNSYPNRPPLILITAFGDEALHERAAKLGARVFDKPFDFDELIQAVAMTLRSE